MLYEMTERIEAHPSGRDFLISHTIQPYLHDFAAVVSFVLECTCTPDYDRARRLISRQRGLATATAQQNLIRRVFDQELWLLPSDGVRLTAFVAHLLTLPRKTYQEAMQAIKIYVTGLNSLAEDIDLGYTLLVASVESLAQRFDGYKPTWDDFDAKKAEAANAALGGAPQDLVDSVRAALLSVEHMALSRRFQKFALDHVDPTFFRVTTEEGARLISRFDLPYAIQQAYAARSKYVHRLKQLPKLLTFSDVKTDFALVDRQPWLTVQGLGKLARHVISNFISLQKAVEPKPHDYLLEIPSVAQVPLDPSLWLANATGLAAEHGAVKLEGFLSQLASHRLGVSGAAISDISDVLKASAHMLPSMKSELAPAFAALMVLWNAFTPQDVHVDITEAQFREFEKAFKQRRIEVLVAHVAIGAAVSWPTSEMERIYLEYLRLRGKGMLIRLPPLFEAAIGLVIAERMRSVGDMVGARRLIRTVVEESGGNAALIEFERQWKESTIEWTALLLPPRVAASSKDPTKT